MKTETFDSPTEKDLTGKPRTSQWIGVAKTMEIKEGQRNICPLGKGGKEKNAQVTEGAVHFQQSLPKILDLKPFEYFPSPEISVSGEEHLF